MAPVGFVETNIDDPNESVDCKVGPEISVDHIPDTLRIFCYTCNTTVNGKDLPRHLLFGRLDCKYCTVKIANCQRFYDIYYKTSVCKHSKSGRHHFLKWQTHCVEYLSYFLRKELVIERFCKNIKGSPSSTEVLHSVRDYVSNLRVIENCIPWEIGLKNCWKYLESKNVYPKSDHIDNSNKKSNDCPSNISSIDSTKSHDEELSEKTSNELRESECLNSKDSSEGFSCEVNKESDITGSTNNLQREQHKDSSENPSRPSSRILMQQHKETKFLKTCSQKQNANILSNNCKTAKSQEEQEGIHEPDDTDEGLLRNFNIERLDQAVEYVTIEDDCREKNRITVSEVTDHVCLEADQGSMPKDCVFSGIKRKSSENQESYVSKISRKCCRQQSPAVDEFKPPNNVSNDHYLVVHFPTEGCPEECPNCYCEFCPSMLTVNCSTYVSTIICADCNLTIYVVPD